jgi:hypothetical protein
VFLTGTAAEITPGDQNRNQKNWRRQSRKCDKTGYGNIHPDSNE